MYAPVVSPRVATKSARVGSRNAPTAAVTASIAFSMQKRHIYVTNETYTHDQSRRAWDHVTHLPQQVQRALHFLYICKETCIYMWQKRHIYATTQMYMCDKKKKRHVREPKRNLYIAFSLHMYMYIYMNINICVYVYDCVYGYIYIYICVCVYIYLWIYICVCMRVYVCMFIDMVLCSATAKNESDGVVVSIWIHTCTWRIYIYIYEYTCASIVC